MNSQQFHNALRIMLNLDADDLRRSGVIDSYWGRFLALFAFNHFSLLLNLTIRVRLTWIFE